MGIGAIAVWITVCLLALKEDSKEEKQALNFYCSLYDLYASSWETVKQFNPFLLHPTPHVPTLSPAFLQRS